MGTVIAIAGHSKSGKTSLAHAVHERTGFPIGSFGAYVRQKAREISLPMSTAEEERTALMRLGQELIDNHLEEFCRGVLRLADWRPGKSAILEGVRHTTVVRKLRALLQNDQLYTVVLETPASIRRQRLEQAGIQGEILNELLGSHPTEREIDSKMAEVADQVLNGTKPIVELAEMVVSHLPTSRSL